MAISQVSCTRDDRPVLDAVLLDRSSHALELYKPNSIIKIGEQSWITDAESESIQIYDSSFAKAVPFGRLGQGPGEFIRPISVAAIGDSLIAVLDVGNSRITIIHIDGTYRQQWAVNINNTRISDMKSTADGHLICALFEKPNLVFTVYDTTGNIVARFCEYLITEHPRYLDHNGVHFEVTSDGHVFVAFRHFPLMRLFDKSYHMVWEKEIMPTPIKKRVKKYGNMLHGGVSALKTNVIPRFYTASTTVNDLMLLAGGTRPGMSGFTNIYVFNLQGEQVNEIRVKMPDNTSQKYFSAMTIQEIDSILIGVLEHDSGVVKVHLLDFIGAAPAS